MLVMLFFGIIIFGLFVAVIKRGEKVDASIGIPSGCLGLLLGVFGGYYVVYALGSAGVFGPMKEDIIALNAMFWGVPSGLLVGALLGKGIAALIKRSRKS